MIYLDYQATTPLAPEAREAMLLPDVGAKKKRRRRRAKGSTSEDTALLEGGL